MIQKDTNVNQGVVFYPEEELGTLMWDHHVATAFRGSAWRDGHQKNELKSGWVTSCPCNLGYVSQNLSLSFLILSNITTYVTCF